MNKSLRSELRKIAITILILVISLFAIFSYLDVKKHDVFNDVIIRNENLNNIYHNYESMEDNLDLYIRTNEIVYLDSHIYYGERLYQYLDQLALSSLDKKYVISYVDRMKKFNNKHLESIQAAVQGVSEELESLQQGLKDNIVYTKSWIMKDLEMATRDYQNKMNQITRLRYIILFGTFIFCIITYTAISSIFIKILSSLRSYQKNAHALSLHQWEVEDVLSNTYVELDKLGRTMNYMKHEIRRYIEQMKHKNQLETQLRDEKLLNEKKDRALIESKLRELNAKVDPHFLFNSLNLVGKYALLEEPEKSMEIIEGISKILRYSLETTGQFASLATELDMINTYIFVQKCRFGSNISYVEDIKFNAHNILIPSMTLQPLIENSFKHGLKNLCGIRIQILAFENEEGIEIQVLDNGNGIDSLDNILNKGVGLKSVSKRLELLYNKKGLLQVESKMGEFTKIKITIPRM